ncbi:putative tyrosine-protein kinase STYK1-like [Scophthalmus maximus]|uniref:Putative tyrosine-protein kinase STYK1-like n=1 Tax=Scophthalmus maximus TaxID=52904 RepID=A0A2U9CWQ5_SCOMX|nr:tyrosine-protein kinase STYK1 isoform X2 [Scophthalmus maximus]XP_035476943.2 tyrosine-protein kinase STYK1 isoform X2 [Scophthalmus maximus]AWP21124.1 putative tyrosine-protein kinase STYK1-like [Scophthalmus maximus]
MSSNSSAANVCAPDDNLCITREHMQAVIIVPTLLLFASLVTLLCLCFLRFCPERRRSRVAAPLTFVSSRRHSRRPNNRGRLQGIDAPPGINPLEHEELPMSVQQVQQSVAPAAAAMPQTSTEGRHGAFSQVTALPRSFAVEPNNAVTVYRARMDNRDVVLRALKNTASSSEKQDFLDFASFVSGLGPHPFLPELLGVVSVQSPPMMVMEELQHRDLLGFLWRCRQAQGNSGLESPCHMTEKRIFIMAGQVASALEYLHGKGCVHGNVAARSVLVGGDLTAKLWGLGPAHRRRTRAGLPGGVATEDTEMRKWQAPEVLSTRAVSQSSDVWSFGILLYEMVTLGEPPFAPIRATELLQHLQRGKHLKRPAKCSNSLYHVVRSCCHWSPQQRPSVTELLRNLRAGEQSANGRTALRASQPIDIEKYLREAGFGETYNYTVL